MKNGEILIKMRSYRKMTQDELGSLIGMSKQQISNLENSADFKYSTLQKIAAALNYKLQAIPIELVKAEFPVSEN